MLKLAHVITGLETGGAEILLSRLLPHLRAAGFNSEVISLTTTGTVGAEIAAGGFRVRALEMSSRLPSPLAVARLSGWLRRGGIDLVQTWLYHGDLIGALAARAAHIAPVIWGVHTTCLDRAWVRRRTRLVAHACAALSHLLPTRIVCCSPSAQRVHRDLGYAGDRLRVIENGVDTDTFAPDPAARAAIREELGLAPSLPLIGMVARFHDSKDHATFAAAAAQLEGPAHFLLCGDGVDRSNRTLVEMFAAAGLGDRVHLLGRREDAPRIFASLDLATLSSRSEAAPLVLAEAMASGVPFVATDVGDCRHMIGDTGRVVPPRNASALAKAWGALLAETPAEKAARGAAARRRITERFSLTATAEQYSTLYRELVG